MSTTEPIHSEFQRDKELAAGRRCNSRMWAPWWRLGEWPPINKRKRNAPHRRANLQAWLRRRELGYGRRPVSVSPRHLKKKKRRWRNLLEFTVILSLK